MLVSTDVVELCTIVDCFAGGYFDEKTGKYLNV